MPKLPTNTVFPEADTYVRYWDNQSGWTYMHLLQRHFPLRYPRRIESLAPGAMSNSRTAFSELDPAKGKNHVYLMYLGCYPEFLYELWQPIDQLQGSFDESINLIDEELTRVVTYMESPYDAPTLGIWITSGKVPGIRIRNVGRATAVAKVLFVGAKYRVAFDEEIPVDAKDLLVRGQIPSSVISLGGDW